MAKGTSNKIARANALRQNTTKNKSTYQRDGFTFLFDDEELQRDYIKRFNQFNNIFKGGNTSLPQPNKITYVDAFSLIRGKNFKELTRLENIYKQNDNNWMKKGGGKVKYYFFDKAIRDAQGSQEISHFTKALDGYIKEIEKATEVDDIEGKSQVKYNIVYYRDYQGV